jgi:hypothetical protein
MIDMLEKGIPPIAGGTLDQAVWFIEASKILTAEESRILAESYKHG